MSINFKKVYDPEGDCILHFPDEISVREFVVVDVDINSFPIVKDSMFGLAYEVPCIIVDVETLVNEI